MYMIQKTVNKLCTGNENVIAQFVARSKARR
jgi:hypothetical protein